MNTPVLLLCLISFALLGALPFVFFRPGRNTAGWWLTATPFFIDAAVLLAGFTNLLNPVHLPAAFQLVLTHAAVPLAAAAIALIGCTIGAHSAPVSMWHQDDDQPGALVMHGPYARIRHPFYASFILMLTAAVLAMPHPLTLLILGVGTVQLNRTARREEMRLTAAFGNVYTSYIERTGRFAPRVNAVRSGAVRADVVHKLAAR